MELFFPSFCLGCHKEGFLLCQDCKSTLEISEYNYCLCNKNPLRIPSGIRNGKPLGFGHSAELSRGPRGKCQRCKDKKLSGLYSALPYKERFLTKKLIYQFKYPPHIKSLAKVLADILIEHLILAGNNAEQIWENSVLIPIPMEKSKQKDRGYNQSEELAKELSKALLSPVITDVLIKIKPTLPQMKLSKEERGENIKSVFAIKNPAKIAGKKIFLIDDVYTTGSTMQECASVLRSAGAKSIWGIAIAREG